MGQVIRSQKPVVGVPPQAVTSLNSAYINLKNYAGVSIILQVNITTGTASGAVTLTQARDVSGSGAKSLSFKTVWVNGDTAASDTLAKATVTGDTFNAGGATKSFLYVIEVKAEDLDVDNGYSCLRISVATIASANGSVMFILHTPRYISEDGGASAVVN